VQTEATFPLPLPIESPAAEPSIDAGPKVADFLASQNYSFDRLREIAEEATDVFTSEDVLEGLSFAYESDAWAIATAEAQSLGFGDAIGLLRARAEHDVLKTPKSTRRALFISALESLAYAEVSRLMTVDDSPFFDPNLGFKPQGDSDVA
jgi:hypothetical protein